MLKINLANYKYSSEAIGDFVKSSKVNFIWEFQLDEIFHRIELRYSRLKGKRVIIVDGHEISKTSKFNLDYNFNFPLGKHFIGITQMDIDKYELKIDNIEIETLYSEIKKNEFIHKIDNFYEDYSENNKKDEGFFSERKNKNEDFDFDFDNGKNNSGKKDNVNKFYFNSEKKQNEEIKKKKEDVFDIFNIDNDNNGNLKNDNNNNQEIFNFLETNNQEKNINSLNEMKNENNNINKLFDFNDISTNNNNNMFNFNLNSNNISNNNNSNNLFDFKLNENKNNQKPFNSNNNNFDFFNMNNNNQNLRNVNTNQKTPFD